MKNLTLPFSITCFIITLTSCGDGPSSELTNEVESLKSENDSLRDLIENDQLLDSVSYDTALYGTTFLPYSSKMIGLLNKGLEAVDFSIIKACEAAEYKHSDYPKFVDIQRSNTTLTIDVEVIANCCHNFLGEAEVLGKDTLNLVYTNYGGFCSRGICTLRYVFNTSLEKEYHILKYVTLNGGNEIGIIPGPE